MACCDDTPTLLDSLTRGEVYPFTVGPTTDPVTDFSAVNLVAYFDPPEDDDTGAVRFVLETADGVIAGDNSSVTFTLSQSRTTAMVDGRWTIRLCFGARTAPDVFAVLILPVTTPDGGPLT